MPEASQCDRTSMYDSSLSPFLLFLLCSWRQSIHTVFSPFHFHLDRIAIKNKQKQKQKHTTVRIRWWSPTQLLT
ncbi:hypothetical protein VN97_g11230, partial [Penicillium thymicola]